MLQNHLQWNTWRAIEIGAPLSNLYLQIFTTLEITFYADRNMVIVKMQSSIKGRMQPRMQGTKYKWT